MKNFSRASRAVLLSCALFSLQAHASEPSNAVPTQEELQNLIRRDTVIGTGAEAVAGKTVTVNYTGWLYDPKAPDLHGSKFDSTFDRNKPFSFPLGAGRVIKGWDQGVVGMKAGGKRTLIIPGYLAYGARGAGNGLIPPDAILVFDVELLGVN